MDWSEFFEWYGLCLLFVLGPVPLMISDQHFTRGQVARSKRKLDYAALEHGGFLMDPFLAWVLAYLACYYTFDAVSRGARLTMVGAIAVTIALVTLWEAAADTIGDCYAHGGETTVAGVVHAVFFTVALGMIAQVYLGFTVPEVTAGDLLFVSIFLTVFLPIGVMKFSPRWSWDKGAVIQVLACELLVWGLTFWRLW